MGLKDFSIASSLFGKPVEELSITQADIFGRKKSETNSSASSHCASLEQDSPVLSSRSSISVNQPRPLRASLPSSWYTSENFFGLEARAIFSQVVPFNCDADKRLQAWHCVTHNNRFQKAGTYYRYNIGTYPIFLILSKDGIIRGFHNICRHRGFPVVAKDEGCSAVIGCRYHGWSYNSRGELVKVDSRLSY